jgi:hypothetical protein
MDTVDRTAVVDGMLPPVVEGPGFTFSHVHIDVAN